MTVLITGGAGFIGANLARYMTQERVGIQVRVLDDLSTGDRRNLDGVDVEFIEGSVADPDVVRDAVDGVDSIVHLGALGSVPRSINDPVSSHTANLTGTLNVLEAARAAEAYTVFSSSSSVYGSNPKLSKSEFDWTRPLSPYAVTKLGAESYVIAYQHAYDLPTLAFRFFNVYGPLQAAGHAYAAVVPQFVEAATNGRPLTVYGDGKQSRDFTNVASVCQALTDAVERKVVSRDPVNLAFGGSTTILELIDIISAEFGETLPVRFLEPRSGDVRRSQSDGVRLRELFPDVQSVPLHEGIAATVAWYRGQRPS